MDDDLKSIWTDDVG